MTRAKIPGAGGDATALIRLSWAGTAVTAVTSIANGLTGDRSSYAVSAGPGLVLFTLGCGAFLWAFALAAQRSRREELDVAGVFILSGSAPRRVQLSMLASLAVQTTVPVAVAIVRPFTAFAVLAPMWAFGLAGMWGARHGAFPTRRAPGAASEEPRAGRADGAECGTDEPRTEGPTDG